MVDFLKIGIIGDHDGSRISQIKTDASLDHASRDLSFAVETVWLPTKSMDTRTIADKMSDLDAVWAGPGDYEDPDGAILAIKHCREKQKPFFAT